MRAASRFSRSRAAVVVAALAALPAVSALANSPGPSFKATKWILFTGGPTAPSPGSPEHKASVKPNGTQTLCNMNQLAGLEIDFSYQRTPGRHFDKHGKLITPFTEFFSGPKGSQHYPYVSDHVKGSDSFSRLYFQVPGANGSTPVPAGKYTFRMRQKSKTLMSVSITLESSKTC